MPTGIPNALVTTYNLMTAAVPKVRLAELTNIKQAQL